MRNSVLTRPAPEEPKEVLTMMNLNTITSYPADFGMPICDRGPVAWVRVLRENASAAAIKGAFLGPNAWSPPS